MWGRLKDHRIAQWTAGYAAIAIFNALPTDEPNRLEVLAMMYASMGRYTKAAELLETIPPAAPSAAFARDAARLLRTAAAKAAQPQSLPGLGPYGWVYLYVGAPERAVVFDSNFARLVPPVVALIWHPSYAPLRKTEAFKTYVRGLGLVEYWRTRGWPEFCHPTGGPGRAEAQGAKAGDDFECS